MGKFWYERKFVENKKISEEESSVSNGGSECGIEVYLEVVKVIDN